MYRTAAINALRKRMEQMGVSAIIIPTNDPHFGEYTQNRYKVREWLSGFTGSAGTLVITLKSAALWPTIPFIPPSDFAQRSRSTRVDNF